MMKIEYLLQKNPEWLKGEGPDVDIVISSRLRLARNIKTFNFTRKASEEQRRKIRQMVLSATERSDYLKSSLVLEMEKLSDLDRQFLVERHVISRELSPASLGGVVISPREVISLMINEEDHLRVQVLQSGFRLTDNWRLINEIDMDLERYLEYAYSPILGYLTACPTNVGTGMRASVMLHLPALMLSQQINQILEAVGKLGLAVRGMYGEGTQASGNMFQMSNQVTLGKSEEEIIQELEKIITKIIFHERTARSTLKKSGSPQLEDKIYRALGILESARLVSSAEATDLLSALRLGVDLGMLKRLSRGMLDELLIITQPAHLQKLAGKTLVSEERDLLRAKLIREKLGKAMTGPKGDPAA